MEDFVSPLTLGTHREPLAAHLHVPVHAFDPLVDLQRSRVQFLSGLPPFEEVAMDVPDGKEGGGGRRPRGSMA